MAAIQIVLLVLLFSNSLNASIRNVNPREPLPMEVMMEAEEFARQRNIEPTELLILIACPDFSNETVRLNSSLLSLPESRYSFSASLDRNVPLFLEVFASNMKVVVISNTLRLAAEPFQNFRHNCLLNIVMNKNMKKIKFPVRVTTLFWYSDRSRRLDCVDIFDNMITVEPNTASRSRTETKCSVKSLDFTKDISDQIPKVFLQASIICNATTYSANFFVTRRAETDFEQSMLNLYSVSKTDTMNCFSLIQWRDVTVTALIEPFELSVWVLIFISTLILAKLNSTLNLKSFTRTLTKIWIHLITVTETERPTRWYSSVLASISALILCFFITQAYNNLIMFSFLNPQILNECGHLYNCRDIALCHVKHVIVSELSVKSCVCNLNEDQQLLAGKPLSRKRVPWGNMSATYRLGDQNAMYFQRRWYPFGGDGKQHLLVPARTSSNVDRFFATGLVSNKKFVLTPTEIRKIRERYYRELRYWQFRNFKPRLEGYIDFDTSIDWFDMDSFRRLQPIFCFCAMTTLALICWEVFSQQRRRVTLFWTKRIRKGVSPWARWVGSKVK